MNNSFDANEYYQKINDDIYGDDDILRQYFSGAWINTEGNLVVNLSGEYEQCEKIICDDLNCSDIIFRYDGIGSKYDNENLSNQFNEKIAYYQNEYSYICDEVAKLLSFYPRVE